MYLLDTNVCVQYLRGKNSHILHKLTSTSPHDIRICAVVVAELYYGCLRSAKPSANKAKVDAFLKPYISLPFDDTAAEVFAQIRYDLETNGTPIGPYDLQIAAIALANGLTLVTHNTVEFGRVSGLACEDWEVP